MPGQGQRHILTGTPIVVTENVQDFREAAAYYLNKNDVVLEVGCAQGFTTAAIAKHAGEAVGVDKSPQVLKVARYYHPDIEFHEIDATDISSILKLGKRWTKIFLDISGSQPVGPLATLVEKYERVFPSVDLFVVKAFRLKKLVGNATVFPEQVTGTTRNKTCHGMLRTPGGQAAPSQEGSRGPRSIAATALRAAACAVAAAGAFGLGVAVGARRR
ncbi:hypothetical protein HYH03_003158 [Edaphochlamys debaryana]|uniref:Methyltransferase domain-containing protein n=1 Tax=Edaphochlamys debaryana TaxID=47281 RepID=A0A836C3D1_9CHLO|nr:hypothetical protein HYH03_003158 [Edaphochlamys debaryana]|eukprot:KAG2498971.1 hypothetical protein HYH03_003158 [Edaphochlamys debaryana]